MTGMLISHIIFPMEPLNTNLDPVEYLNRYSDLQAVFGTDIMAAYKHYKEFGQQEGREGRSEATVKAEKEAGKSPGSGGKGKRNNIKG